MSSFQGNPSPLQPTKADDTSATTQEPTVMDKPTQLVPRQLLLDIFPNNVARPTLTTELPKPHARIENTPQLVFVYSLLTRSPSTSVATTGGKEEGDAVNDSPVAPLTDNQREWVKSIDPVEQGHFAWIVEQLVNAFSEDTVKSPIAIAEIVLLGPILDHDTFRSLLSCFISKFEQTIPMDLTLLQGLVQFVECAAPGYLVDNDLVRITTVLSKELAVTHNGTSNHLLHLTMALSRVLDVMVAGGIKDLNRERDHQPLMELLAYMMGDDNIHLKYQAAYAYQALQYLPDDETPLQVVWRYADGFAIIASTATDVFDLKPSELVEGLGRLEMAEGTAFGAVGAGIESFKTLTETGQGGVTAASKHTYRSQEKRSWYLALQVTAGFIQRGRLQDLNRLVCAAPCRHNANFQWGVCRQLGEITTDSLWDDRTRQQAVDFLDELYRNENDWKMHTDIKRWVLAVLVQISALSDPSLKDRAAGLIARLKDDGMAALPVSCPLSTRLPMPSTFPLLSRVQEISAVEYTLHILKMTRLGEYRQSVYIPPLAKPSLQASDDNLFPLMDEVQEFLAGDGQVMLILGDSGSGKSAFNRYFEHRLWIAYKQGGPIPLFVNLLAIDRPDQDLIGKQLKLNSFKDDQIQELKQHRQLVLICDGYDESQLLVNLHKTNLLNQPGQWKTKMVISCRTQFLGPIYLDRFKPQPVDRDTSGPQDLFQEAVIAPFSKDQINSYVDQFARDPQTKLLFRNRAVWSSSEYMDKLMAIPNVMDLVKNPFLLTLALKALPALVQSNRELSSIRVTRVGLYDSFVDQWLETNRRRLQTSALSKEKLEVLNCLLDDDFTLCAIDYLKRLAVSIFKEQDGAPIVQYSQRQDKDSWKAAFFGTWTEAKLLLESSPLVRTGHQYRFVHRSMLEYFFSRAIYDPVNIDAESCSPAMSVPFSIQLTDTDGSLFQRSLLTEPSVIQFLCDRVQQRPDFEQQLRSVIEQSKTDASTASAAANAITILVGAKVRFNASDLRGIRIPGADLSGTELDSVQFRGADLTGVNLSRSWLRQANFSHAQMSGVQFGEWPFLEMDKEATFCAYSTDGKSFAVGLSHGNIFVYDTVSWIRHFILRGHSKGITCLAYSQRSKELLSASRDETWRVWKLDNGEPGPIHGGNGGVVSSIAISSDDRQLATGGADSAIRLRRFDTFLQSHLLKGHTDSVSCLQFSPAGTTLSSGSSDRTVRLWSTEDGETKLILQGHTAGITSVAISPDGRRLVSGSNDNSVRLWDLRTGDSLATLRNHTDRVSAVTYSPNGDHFASAGWDKTVRIWEAETDTHAQVSVLRGATQIITSLAISPFGLEQVAACSNDRTVRLWDATPRPADSFTSGAALAENESNGHIAGISTMAISPDGQQVVSGGYDMTVRTYDASNGLPLRAPLDVHTRSVTALVFSPNEQVLASASWDHTIRLWDLEKREMTDILRGHLASVTSLAFLLSDGQLVSGSGDWTVRLWNLKSQETVRVFKGHTQGVRSVACSPDGSRIASGSEDKTVRIWNVRSRETELVLRGHTDSVACVVYSPSGGQIASASEDRTVRVWSAAAGSSESTSVLVGHQAGVQCVAYSPDGRCIASGSDDNTVIVWSATSGSRLTVLADFFGGISSVVWKPWTECAEAMCLITGSKDSSIRAWEFTVHEDGAQVQLAWGIGFGHLVVSGARIEGATGLSPVVYELLKQRGAVGSSEVSTQVEELPSEAEE